VERSSRHRALVRKRLATGAFADAEDVIRRALEAQNAEESWTEEERAALSTYVEEGFLQAERGELIDGDEALREIQARKEWWLQERSLACRKPICKIVTGFRPPV